MVINCCQSNQFVLSNSKYLEKNDSINLYAFVGKKISVIEFDPNENYQYSGFDSLTGETITYSSKYVMDNAFLAKYKVLQNVFNELPRDTIEFIVYDHYGRPGFENEEIVLLYLGKYEDKDEFFHKKYQFDKLYKDHNGIYYGFPKFSQKTNTIKDSLNGFKPKNLDEKISLRYLDENKSMIPIIYPTKFYKIKDNFAYPIRGLYLEELIKLRLYSFEKVNN